MKKLVVLIGLVCFVFTACNNKTTQKEETVEPQQEQQVEEKTGCCQEMTEEQKADMAAWNDWDNQTAEKKAELVEKVKTCIDKMMAEKKDCCENKEGEAKECCKDGKCAEMKAKFENWANLTVEEKKALLDEVASKKCCKEGEKKEACCDHDHGDHNHKH